jgi:hypothetical protein
MSRTTLLLICATVSVVLPAAAFLAVDPLLSDDVIASYEVRGDGIVLLEGDPEPWHQAAWDRWVELVPASDRWRVGRFEAIEGSSDGQLEPISNSLQVWILRISDLEAEVLDVALIHELGHLVSLGPGQIVPVSDSTGDCPTTLTIEGCAVADGVYDRFAATFWSETWEEGETAATDRHSADREAFVTRYAATNPGEDLAETFVFFVYRFRPDGPTMAEEKIRLLWEFPELVELREALRLRLVTG